MIEGLPQRIGDQIIRVLQQFWPGQMNHQPIQRRATDEKKQNAADRFQRAVHTFDDHVERAAEATFHGTPAANASIFSFALSNVAPWRMATSCRLMSSPSAFAAWWEKFGQSVKIYQPPQFDILRRRSNRARQIAQRNSGGGSRRVNQIYVRLGWLAGFDIFNLTT